MNFSFHQCACENFKDSLCNADICMEGLSHNWRPYHTVDTSSPAFLIRLPVSSHTHLPGLRIFRIYLSRVNFANWELLEACMSRQEMNWSFRLIGPVLKILDAFLVRDVLCFAPFNWQWGCRTQENYALAATCSILSFLSLSFRTFGKSMIDSLNTLLWACMISLLWTWGSCNPV